MNKYIDAEKLKAEIESIINSDGPVEYNLMEKQAYNRALSDAIDLIDSLQQEKPAKRGYKYCNGCKYNRILKDQIGWQFRGCFGGDYTGKPIAEIELCPLSAAVQQEQPEVDLEKEIENHIKECLDVKFPTTDIELIKKDVAYTARKFYKLGFNARKKEYK